MMLGVASAARPQTLMTVHNDTRNNQPPSLLHSGWNYRTRLSMVEYTSKEPHSKRHANNDTSKETCQKKNSKTDPPVEYMQLFQILLRGRWRRNTTPPKKCAQPHRATKKESIGHSAAKSRCWEHCATAPSCRFHVMRMPKWITSQRALLRFLVGFELGSLPLRPETCNPREQSWPEGVMKQQCLEHPRATVSCGFVSSFYVDETVNPIW
mmetsp:Transcript_6096/g.11743  ORF Transcript_6096/g.11743 Transcript_6096/m.11743 type:complete len:210 (+) Transcript_6096:449-1078(+)